MLTPPTLYAGHARRRAADRAKPPGQVRRVAAYAVEQRFATSKDGTRVPYFLVRKKGVAGPVPTLIHAYGGFRVAQTPGYLTGQPYRAGPLGLFWVEQGNAYVLANIRGGGEYGPGWHEAALREKRQNSFDDLHAVAEDVIRSGVASKGRDLRPLERRRAGRRRAQPAPRSLFGRDHRLALVRHEALFAPARRRFVDR